MISFKISCEEDALKYETSLAKFSNLSKIYSIYIDNIEVGCFGYVETTQLNVDRIIGLVISIDQKYQNKGYFKLVGNAIRDKLISNSSNGKIWILTQLLNIKSRMFAKYFGLKNIHNNGFYLLHNTNNDEQALLFANLLIDKLIIE
jgi:hypothetical protein